MSQRRSSPVKPKTTGSSTLLSPPVETEKSVAAGYEQSQYVHFTIQLTFEENNEVGRIQVRPEEKKWTPWAERMEGVLNDSIKRDAGLRSVEFESIPALASAPETTPTGTTKIDPHLSVADPVRSGGSLSLRQIETTPIKGTHPSSTLPAGEPFNLHLTFDLTKVVLPLSYSAVIYAKNLKGGLCQKVSEKEGIITSEDVLTLTMTGEPLPQGIYRLEALVILTLPGAEQGPATYLEGAILQVH